MAPGETTPHTSRGLLPPRAPRPTVTGMAAVPAMDFAGPPRAPRKAASATDGPWVLFDLADGSRWVATFAKECEVREAVLLGCEIAPAEPMRAEVVAEDYARLLLEAGEYCRFVLGGLELKRPFNRSIVVGCAP